MESGGGDCDVDVDGEPVRRRRSARIAALTSRLDWLGREMHPLQNPYIMEEIIKYLSISDLKNCRLVGSDLWSCEIFKKWRKQAVLCFNTKANPSQGANIQYLRKKFRSDEDYLHLKSVPYKSYIFSGFNITYVDNRNPECFWLLENFSEKIKNLTLRNCTFNNVQTFASLILRNLPCLEKLKLEDSITFINIVGHVADFSAYGDHPNLKCLEMDTTSKLVPTRPFPWHEFLEKLPKLESLHIRLNYQNTQHEVFEIIWGLCVCRNYYQPQLSLKDLEIYPVNVIGRIFCHQDKYVDIYDLISAGMKNPFKLERFIGSVYYISHMKQYLTTLKFLRLRFIDVLRHCMPANAHRKYGMDKRSVTFKFSELKELHCLGRLSNIFINLGKCEFPKLKKLRLEGPSDFRCLLRDAPNIVRPIRSKRFETVEEFECYHTKCVFRKREIERLARSMPNVKRLVMPLTSKTFPVVCRVWPKLQKLTILESEKIIKENRSIDDKAITGINDDPNEEEREPCLKDLKELSNFTIQTEQGNAKLTDEAVRNGFLLSQSLRHLNVVFEKISLESRIALKKKLHTMEIQVKPTTQPQQQEQKDNGNESEEFDSEDSVVEEEEEELAREPPRRPHRARAVIVLERNGDVILRNADPLPIEWEIDSD